MQFTDARSAADGNHREPQSGVKTPFAFVHIPKCSGTAFENYMLSQGGGFVNSRAFTGLGINDKPESLEAYFENEKEAAFVFGHFYYRDPLRFCPGAFTATFLRDPLRRTISQYKSWHDEKNFQPDDPHYKVANPVERDALIFAQQASLEDFLRTDNRVIVDGALGNQQTLYLSTYSGENLAQHLESAKKNLANFDFFGITDKFLESLELLRLMVPDLSDYKVSPEMENRSRISVDEVTESAREIIAEQVTYDQQLYDYACQLFNERLKTWRGEIQASYSVKCFGTRTGVHEFTSIDDQPFVSQRESLHFLISKLELENKKITTENSELRAQLAQMEVTNLQASELNETVLQVARDRVAELAAENDLFRNQLAQLSASHTELQQVYRDIVRSRSWRVMQAFQSVVQRFISK